MFIFPQLSQYFYLKFGCANQDPSKALTLQLNDADLSTPSRVCTPFLFPIADWLVGETRPLILWVSHSCALLAGSPFNMLLWLLARSRADSSVMIFWQAYFMGWCLASIRRRMCEQPWGSQFPSITHQDCKMVTFWCCRSFCIQVRTWQQLPWGTFIWGRRALILGFQNK